MSSEQREKATRILLTVPYTPDNALRISVAANNCGGWCQALITDKTQKEIDNLIDNQVVKP